VPTFANPVVLTPVFGGTTNSSVNNGDGTATYVTNENIQGNNKSLVGTLDLISARPSQNRAVFFSTNLPKPGDLNGGLTGNQEVQAAEAYLSQNGNAGFVSVSYQTDATSVATINDPRGPAVAGVGGIVPVNASAIAAGLPATNAPNVTFQYIYNNLLAQNMVMADYGLANGANAHAFDIIAAGTILGNPYILMQSDINQTATDPTDTDLGGGLEFSYLTTAPNGEIFLPNVGANMELQDDIVIAVPEPTSLGVLAAIGLLSLRRRKRPC
jgi:hypothetical protein